MIRKVIYAVALTACVTVACQEQQIAPSHSAAGNSNGIGSPAAVRAHLKKLDKSLVAYYPFNGNANDLSGNRLHGTVNGATLTTDRHGKTNAAYALDGDDYISVADNNLLDFGARQDFTISLWVEIGATQNLEGGINDILRKWSGDAQGYPFSISFLNETSTDPEKILVARFDGQNCGNGPIAFSQPVQRGTFLHITKVKKGTELKLYINGVLVSTVTDTTTCSTANDSHMTIGARGQLARFFTGKID